MRTLILAAGLGTRLRPLTDTMPKALVPVSGQPLLQHTLNALIRQGATEAIVNVHHFSRQIVSYLQQNPQPIPVKVSDESAQLLNTGGGIRQAVGLLPSDCEEGLLVHNVDILSNADLRRFYGQNAHRPAALLVSRRQSTRQLIVRDHRLVGWKNLTTGEVRGSDNGESYAFSGIHIISPTLVRTAMASYPPAFSIMDFYLSVCADVPIHVVPDPQLQLLDVGKTASLSQAADFLARHAG
ncbi:MAG: NTP transferase domain-containing protein [Bacteroidaceae bacterium]|nr:NTP transferase domain-containing protein [Candidatus Equimonas faecalis]MCQ2205154.1 NTP transferase domain-containing protein [Bacteroidaceae bacterium]